jgi:hypothetical protein
MNDLVLSVPGDGFEQARDGRVIQGTLLKYTNEGKWPDKPESSLLALACNTINQLWQNQKPVDTMVKKPGEPLPSVDDLNAEIPKEQWEIGLDGKPRPPWQQQQVVYFLDPRTAAKYTYASGTIGARIAVEKLRDQVVWMRQLRGANVVPVVDLSNAPMKTRYGDRLRPSFVIKGWVALGEQQIPVARIDDKSVPAGVTPITPPTMSEWLSDEIPF